MTLETPRTILRNPAISDAKMLRDYHLRNEARFAPWQPLLPPEIEAHRAWIAARIRAASDRTGPFAFFAFEKVTSELVAVVDAGAFSSERPTGATFNYTVDGAYEGRGFAGEAFAAIIAYAFDELGLDAAWAYYHPDNVRSERLLARSGFTILARPPSAELLKGTLRPSVVALRLRGGPHADRAATSGS